MDARTFLGMEPVGDRLHWQMRVDPHVTRPRANFLFGGCGLGRRHWSPWKARPGGRPYGPAEQYLSLHAPTHSLVEVGSHVSR